MKTSDDPLELEPVLDALPAGFDALRAEALAEGFRQVERLAADWKAGRTRFDRDGEALLAARLNGVLAGIGGLTMEPVVPGALRMRRFYVRPAFRRIGVGRQLVTALLAGVDGERSTRRRPALPSGSRSALTRTRATDTRISSIGRACDDRTARTPMR